jgi:hypothetical protein
MFTWYNNPTIPGVSLGNEGLRIVPFNTTAIGVVTVCNQPCATVAPNPVQ